MASQASGSAGPARQHAPAVRMQGIVKHFDGVEALDGVDFELVPGEIHGLLGENGAGKTTLMNILDGLIAPDAGTVSIRGERVALRGPRDAIAHGIGMVHQHFMLVPTLTVAENMILGEPVGPLLPKHRVRAVEEQVRQACQRYGLAVDPRAPVWQLSVGQQQRVEILRALYRNASILILDEPTATLTPIETEQLLPRLRALADEGAAVVFITHHLSEVLEWTDRITVLRRGKRVATLRPCDTSARELARIMVGREVALRSLGMEIPAAEGHADAAGDVPARAVLSVRGLEARSDRGTLALRGVDITACAGEIVAVVGVEGNGQAELEEVLFGLRPVTQGCVLLDGEDVTRLGPRARLDRGLGIIPSDRYRRGLVRALSVADNLVMDRIGEEPFGKRTVRRQAIWSHGRELIERFSIRVAGPGQSAGTLSGGNAQRVVLARALSRDLRCLVAAQPARGLDVGSTEFVWSQLDATRRRSDVAILLISTDLDEVLAISDRCFVIYRGQFVASWPRAQFDRERIGLAMGGVVEAAGGTAGGDES